VNLEPTAASIRTKWVGYALALVVAGLLVYAVIVAAGGIGDALEQLRHATRIWLIPGLVLEVCSYSFAGWLLRLLRGTHETVGWPTTVRVALVMWGLGSLLPASPAEGIAMSVSELRRRGVDRQQSLTMLLFAGWLQFWALVVTAAVAAGVVAAAGPPDRSDVTRLVAVAAVLAVVAITVISVTRRPITGQVVADIIWRLPHHRKRTRDELRAAGVNEHARLLALLGNPWHQVQIAATSIGWWITDAGCLWVALHAAHAHVSFGLVLLAYVAGTAASWVPLLPGGLGAVEAVVPAVLHHFGVPLTTALAGTLLWRGLSLFLPTLAGAFAYASLRAQRV
jgi:uncharacterized protein (TIRG00374 family)